MTVTATTPTGRRSEKPADVCSRVLVGIDGSPESLEAARQAARLLVSDGQLTLLTAFDIPATLVGGLGGGVPTYVDEDLHRARAAKAVEAARRQVGDTVSAAERVVRGRSSDALIREAEREHDTLIAVGSHGRGRMTGIVLGSTATAIVHKAPGSVLVARAATSPFPSSILVGVDGSRQSLAAAEVAAELATRLGATVQALAATGERPVDVDGLVELRRRFDPAAPVGSTGSGKASSLLRWSDQPPVEALLGASGGADLLVVGSRGLHGLATLGSVSERIAHEAHCSVLVVREAKWD